MKSGTRRKFLATGLALPAAARRAMPSVHATAVAVRKSKSADFPAGDVQYRTLVVKCPYGVQVAQRLSRAQELFA